MSRRPARSGLIRSAAPPLNRNSYQRIYAVVSQIPKGRVATYGQIAALAGLAGQARLVGYALGALGDDSIPWQRVINARGEISPRAGGCPADELQRLRLEAEGIVFDSHGRIPFASYRWHPEAGIAGDSVPATANHEAAR